MKNEVIKPGQTISRYITGVYNLKVRNDNFALSSVVINQFTLGSSSAGKYNDKPLGQVADTLTPIASDVVDHRWTVTGETELAKWFAGEASDRPSHIAFGIGTTAFSTNDTDITTLSDRCVASWDFDQNPGGGAPQLTDQTGNSVTGTTSGSMVAGDEVAGKIGNAWDFDGVNDQVSFGANANLIFDTNGFGLSIWVKPGATGAQKIFDFNSDGISRIYLAMDFTGGQDEIKIEGVTDSVSVVGDWMASGAWSHFVISLDRTGATDDLTVYHNGSSVGTDSSAALGSLDFTTLAAGDFILGDVSAGIYNKETLGPTSKLVIGSGSDGADFYTGLVDDTEVFNYPPSSTDATGLYNAGSGRAYPFWARAALGTKTLTDGSIAYSTDIDPDSPDVVNLTFTEIGIFNAATDGDLYTRYVVSPFSMTTGLVYRITFDTNFLDLTAGRGIFTTAGLNETRDWVSAGSGVAPIQTAWGTGTTNPAVGNTTLEGEQERNAFTGTSRVGTTITYNALLTSAEANATTITKSALFNLGAGGDMFTEQLFAGIAKTALIQVLDYETIKFV